MIPFPLLSEGLLEQAMNLMWIEEIGLQESNDLNSFEDIEEDDN